MSDKTIKPNKGNKDSKSLNDNNAKTVRPSNGSKDNVSDNMDCTVRTTAIGANDEKTVRVSASSQNKSNVDKTIKPINKLPDNCDKTVNVGYDNRNVNKGLSSITKSIHESFYVLENVRYDVNKVISSSSGEAIVLLVENAGKSYILKLYYEDIAPDHDILNKVCSVNGSDVFVRIVSHGIWTNRDNGITSDNEISRHYELIEYYPKGNLDNIEFDECNSNDGKVDLHEKEIQITRIIVQMAFAINLCHELGFLHRDIKLSNFLYSNKDPEKILLGDFGIAVDYGSGGNVIVADNARTKIYAAPEVYLQTGNQEVHISAKSDYYSLGMILLRLWIGKEKFSQFEREKELTLAEIKNRDQLPRPEGMSDRLLGLFLALTCSNSEQRAGHADIVKWINNEPVFDKFLENGKEKVQGFEILYKPQQIAHSPEELVKYMMADQTLAIKYLYGKRISKWLDEQKRPELAVEIENIVEQRYPKSHIGGFYAACYALDKTMPYYDSQNRPCKTHAEIAKTILENFNDYEQLLSKGLKVDENQLFVYLKERHKLSALVKIVEKTSNYRQALLELVYRLDNSLPFYIIDNNGERYECNCPDDILNVVALHELSKQSSIDLCESPFLIWLKKRNEGIVNRILSQIRGLPQSSCLYAILYNLNPRVSYTFVLDENSDAYIFSHTQIAHLINRAMEDFIHSPQNSESYKNASQLISNVNNIKNTQLYFYLKSKGDKYNQWINWIEYCTDLNSEDNKNKAAPYNVYIATYKVIKGMGVEPTYKFKKSGKVISKLSELKSISHSELNEEMIYGHLGDWLTVHFHENDSVLDKGKKFAFEKSVEKYVDYIKSLNLTDDAVERYSQAKKQVQSTSKRIKRKLLFLSIMRIIAVFCCFVPIFLLSYMIYENGISIDNPIEAFSLMGPLTIICTIYVWLMDDNGGGCLGQLMVGAICAAIINVVLWLALTYLLPYTTYICIFLLLLLAWYIFKVCYIDAPLKRKANRELIRPGFEELVLEPLDYAYRRYNNAFDSSLSVKSNNYIDYLDKIRKKFFFRAIPISIITIVSLFLFYNYAVGAEKKNPIDQDVYTELLGGWTGTFDGRKSTLKITNIDTQGNIDAVVSVKYNNQIEEEVFGIVKDGVIQFNDKISNNRLDGVYGGILTTMNGTYILSGTYSNKKSGKKVEFKFTKDDKSSENSSLERKKRNDVDTSDTNPTEIQRKTEGNQMPKSTSKQTIQESSSTEPESPAKKRGPSFRFEPVEGDASKIFKLDEI